jgi:hypothetical protein
MKLELRQVLGLICEACGQMLPTDEARMEMALFGVVDPCPKCGNPANRENTDQSLLLNDSE